MHYQVSASSIQGRITIPPSKSHTLRAILFASLAQGKSNIYNYLHSPDTTAMINACRLLGASITATPNCLTITGTSGKPTTPSNIIDAGNSGQVLRFVGAIAALTEGYTVLTGDHSIRHYRPVQPLLDGLTQWQVTALSTQNNGHAPILIKGPLVPGKIIVEGQDSQPVSGLLMAAAFAKGESEIIVNHPGETPWVALTLNWFDRLGILYTQENFERYTIPGQSIYSGFEYHVPGDFSSAAFPIAAALITQSELQICNVDMNDCQGDKILIPILQTMGATIEIDQPKKCLWIKKTTTLKGKVIDVNPCIDAVPILAVLACFACGETQITGAAIAKQKESDRLSSMQKELSKMGAHITETAQGLCIQPCLLQGAHVKSHQDHRIAMALSIAGCQAQGATRIEDTDCVAKSYPQFIEAMQAIGMKIEAFV